MERLEYIDSYFKGELGSGESSRFEEKIISDLAFAEEVVHYLSFLQVAKDQADEEKKKRFRELYRQHKTGKSSVVRRMWPTIAVAALVAGVIFGWYLFMQPVSSKQIADTYIREHFQTLSISMGAQDSMQVALKLYNEEKLTEALHEFQKIIESNPSNYTAIKNAGIVSLRLQHYDQALEYFKELESHTELFSNPALLYQAITLMKRNHAGDAEAAKKLLQQVIDKDLEGKEEEKE